MCSGNHTGFAYEQRLMVAMVMFDVPLLRIYQNVNCFSFMGSMCQHMNVDDIKFSLKQSRTLFARSTGAGIYGEKRIIQNIRLTSNFPRHG